MGVSPMSTTGVPPVGLPSHGRAGTALRLMAKMAMPRCERVGVLIFVVYLPPAGKGNFFQPGVRRRAAVQAIAPRVGDVGVRVAGRAVGVLNGAGDVAPGVAPSRLNVYGVPRYSQIFQILQILKNG